ncbi:DUF1850 domain-containing protein [Thalassobacillus pellis]|uniref:DUF1850 domain-containing protein n=1 Tax=Thalassobacillus pellis TaxID=748008 RepID=UPI0019614BC8|nr:DUF1850 domain-containing protein [Thalassobacillus pellis]MBM7551154.1 hypothetical protein [Thalassobacillus pellis]
MRTKRKWISAAIGLVLILLVWLFIPYHYVLGFQKPKEDELLMAIPIAEGDTFQLKYTHSIHLSEVIEEFKIKNDKLYPVKLIYEDTAVGMPSNAGKREQFELRNGKYYITGLNGSHQSITLSVGEVRAAHKIVHDSRTYLLKEYVGAGTIVKIKPQHVSKWQLLGGVKVHE